MTRVPDLRLTRDPAPGWSGRVGRIDLPAVRAALEGLGGLADAFACGPDGFVEIASSLLMQAKLPSHAIRTEPVRSNRVVAPQHVERIVDRPCRSRSRREVYA